MATIAPPSLQPYSVPASAAKSHLAEWLRVVEAGEHVVITRHGRAIAALVPADELVQLELLRSAGAAGGLVALAGGWEGSEELANDIAGSRRGPVRAAPKLP
jgi:prevent-host-death family protein